MCLPAKECDRKGHEGSNPFSSAPNIFVGRKRSNNGDVAEWSNALVLKTRGCNRSVSSNLTVSAAANFAINTLRIIESQIWQGQKIESIILFIRQRIW